jgi:hypothetical protein
MYCTETIYCYRHKISGRWLDVAHSRDGLELYVEFNPEICERHKLGLKIKFDKLFERLQLDYKSKFELVTIEAGYRIPDTESKPKNT